MQAHCIGQERGSTNVLWTYGQLRMAIQGTENAVRLMYPLATVLRLKHCT